MRMAPAYLYNPPQRADYLKEFRVCLCCLDFGTRDSTACSSVLPCLLAGSELVVRCLSNAPRVSVIDIRSNDDEWIHRMCANIHPSCPPELRGIYWMQDNPMPESLVTVHEAVWDKEGKGGVKTNAVNWSKDFTLIGWGWDWTSACTPCWKRYRFERRGSRWLALMGIDISELPVYEYLYLVAPGDTFYDACGHKMERIVPHQDAIRYIFSPDGSVSYQYHMRKIVSIDDEGKPKKLEPAFSELRQHYSKRAVSTCAPFYCGEDRNAGSGKQIIRFAPPSSPTAHMIRS